MLTAEHIERFESLDAFLLQNLDKELLRFTTAGSVDDGKSTLIGRLLHDSKAVYEDQLASIKKSRLNRSTGPIDFSLLTDGLRAEREQGITIDVAYRYFSTAHRKFIIADTPGHEQYTRNMATGASTADLAIILIDASKGLLPQTHRHAYIASLLGIPHVLAAINKMDLIEYREDVFLKLVTEFTALAGHLGIPFVQCIPISALEGDNIVSRSEKTHWYSGPTLLRHLETVPPRSDDRGDALRLPIQLVNRPDRTFRGFSGRIAGGTIRPGDPVLALPSGQQTTIESIVSFDGDLAEAISSESVTLKLAHEIDLSRGDMLVSPLNPPHVSSRFSAMVVWLNAKSLQLNQTYLLKHSGRQVRARATSIRFRIDVNRLTEHAANELEMNGIASVDFETSAPLFFDAYSCNRTTGSFILIDPISNATVGAAMIREDLSGREVRPLGRSGPVNAKSLQPVTVNERNARHGHRPALFSVVGDRVWAERLERALFQKGFEALMVRASDVSHAALPQVLSSLWRGGTVIVLSSDAVSDEQEAVLGAIAGESLFTFSVVSGDCRAETLLKEALIQAETLRIDREDSLEGKVN